MPGSDLTCPIKRSDIFAHSQHIPTIWPKCYQYCIEHEWLPVLECPDQSGHSPLNGSHRPLRPRTKSLKFTQVTGARWSTKIPEPLYAAQNSSRGRKKDVSLQRGVYIRFKIFEDIDGSDRGSLQTVKCIWMLRVGVIFSANLSRKHWYHIDPAFARGLEAPTYDQTDQKRNTKK